MPKSIGFYDLSPYLQELLTTLRDIPEEFLSDELLELIKHPTNINITQLSQELITIIETVNNVGYDNLDDELKQKMDDLTAIIESGGTGGGGGSADTVYISTNNIFKGTRVVEEDCTSVNFICGEIEEFNVFKDTLNVYLNSVRLAEGIDYRISEDKVTIECLIEGGWKLIKGETTNIFEFEQYKNSTSQSTGSGSITNDYLADNTITMDKLSPSVQEMILNSVSVTKNNVLYGYKTIDFSTDKVNFICGEINVFDREKDTIEVYLNTTRLTRGAHYEVADDNQCIVNLEEGWNLIANEHTNFFEFVVTRNSLASYDPEGIVFVRNENIEDDTIEEDKLSPDLRDKITAVSSYQHGYIDLYDEVPYTEIDYSSVEGIDTITENSILFIHVNGIKLINGLDYRVDIDTHTILLSTEYKGSADDHVFIEIEVLN